MNSLSNTTLNKIGDSIRNGKYNTQYGNHTAIEILDTWREAHGKILDEYYDKCIALTKKIDKNNIIVAQRLKRLPTIIEKLNRFKNMRLSSMQDIAGIRIIVDGMTQLNKIEQEIKNWDNLKRVSDYIKEPKKSGYRGKHFIFEQDGLYVEIQLRTQLQHLWATSVETTDVFRGTMLKEIDDTTCWHDFFCQVSSIFAITEESPTAPGYRNLNISELCNDLQKNLDTNHIMDQITSFALTDPIVSNEKLKDTYYMVITLDSNKKEAHISSYKESDYHSAFNEYKRKEHFNSSTEQTVLVGLNQVKKVRDAYPNYFMNLSNFYSAIMYILAKNKKKR